MPQSYSLVEIAWMAKENRGYGAADQYRNAVKKHLPPYGRGTPAHRRSGRVIPARTLKNARRLRPSLHSHRTPLRAQQREARAQDSISRQYPKCHRPNRRANQHRQIQQIRHQTRLSQISKVRSTQQPPHLPGHSPLQAGISCCDCRRKTDSIDPLFC